MKFLRKFDPILAEKMPRIRLATEDFPVKAVHP